jgi:hypothetical protein
LPVARICKVVNPLSQNRFPSGAPAAAARRAWSGGFGFLPRLLSPTRLRTNSAALGANVDNRAPRVAHCLCSQRGHFHARPVCKVQNPIRRFACVMLRVQAAVDELVAPTELQQPLSPSGSRKASFKRRRDSKPLLLSPRSHNAPAR